MPVDGTYQRFDAPTVETEEKADSFLGKFISSIENYLNYVILGAAVLFVILIVILIVLAVKLHNRNAELDELYDEYGIDLDEEEEALKAKKKEEKQEKKAKKASKQVSKKASKKYDDENEFEGYDEDDLWVTENIAKAMEKP